MLARLAATINAVTDMVGAVIRPVEVLERPAAGGGRVTATLRAETVNDVFAMITCA